MVSLVSKQTTLVGVIQDTETLEFITFDSFEPPQKARDVTYDDVPVRGRSEPHSFYAHTGGEVWQFVLHLRSSINQGDLGPTPTVSGEGLLRGAAEVTRESLVRSRAIAAGFSVMEKERFISSLLMPDYGNQPGAISGVVKPPHFARIAILGMMDVVGTIRGLSSTLLPPYDVVTGFPQQIDVSFSLYAHRSFGQRPLGFADIRRLRTDGIRTGEVKVQNPVGLFDVNLP